MRYNSILDTIGNTPLVELKSFSPRPGVQIFAKLEGFNPSGSVKDRIAKLMIEEAEASGNVKPGSILLEPTSGNTGIALAMIARVKGYEFIAVMPDNVTQERRKMLELFGATIVYSDGALGSNGAVKLAQELASQDDRYVMLYQYGNDANPRAHYEGTALEIIKDLPDLDVFVAGLGTGGTLTGNARRLKEYNPAIKIVAAEPLQGDGVQGLRSLEDGFVPPVLDQSLLRCENPCIRQRCYIQDSPAQRSRGNLCWPLVWRSASRCSACCFNDGSWQDCRNSRRWRLEVPE